jgi:hypothetical protein
MSTVVRSMRGKGARRTMWAASGSNQKLNSWRGWVANSGSSGREASAHDGDAGGELGEVRIDGEGEGDVGERAGGVDGDLVGMRVDLANEEVSGVLVEGLGGGRAFRQGWDDEGTMVGLHVGVVGERAPGSVPGEGADERALEEGLLLGADEGENGSGDDGDIGAVDEFEHAQGVLDLLRLPRVAGDHGDAEDFDGGGLEQDHHGHLVGAGGAGAVLIDEDEAGRGGLREGGKG